MLFNSYVFLFLFLPVTLTVYLIAQARGMGAVAMIWATLASLFFYGWWHPAYLTLIVASVLFNYALGQEILRRPAASRLAVLGIAVNLGVLGYFKYRNFFVDTANWITGLNWGNAEIVLPLAISFFTFQQISYLVDCRNRKLAPAGFQEYAFYVTFFPQLIAGPIVRFDEMFDQIRRGCRRSRMNTDLAIGISIFVIGLFKKVVIADYAAGEADPIFAAAADRDIIFLEAWKAALFFTAQIYFDFSGYSDMAIGLARMFGFRLPINFYSPYRAASIIDFWRRWHMTLSRFLRDYLYKPLGGNRKGLMRRHVNLIIVMLLGGLWHGAAWTFVLWGGLHGLALMVNHLWQTTRLRAWLRRTVPLCLYGAAAVGLTLLFVVVGWIVFRAESWPVLVNLVSALLGMDGRMVLPDTYGVRLGGLADDLARMGVVFRGHFDEVFLFGGIRDLSAAAALILVTLVAPNTQQVFRRSRPALLPDFDLPVTCWGRWLRWRPAGLWAAVIAAAFAASVLTMATRQNIQFLYFQF